MAVGEGTVVEKNTKNQTKEQTTKRCFVITPIGEEGSDIRIKIDGLIDEVLKPILSDYNYTVEVSHRISESGSITNQVIKHVYESDLVIANLTGNNPNVLYEVALRHAAAKPIIHITEKVKDLPFDIHDQRAIEYSDTISGSHKLKVDLNNALKGLDIKKQVTSPVTLALGKVNIVDIPDEVSTNFVDLLSRLTDQVNILYRDVQDIRSDKRAEAIIRGKEVMLNSYYDKVKSRALADQAKITLDDVF